jgi:hypothetical protein
MACPGVLGLLLLAAVTIPSKADPVYDPHSTVNGKTLGEWSASWWQWAFSYPLSDNPLFDGTGADAFLGNVGNAFFFAGALGFQTNPLDVVVTRTVSIPNDLPIFFPLINVEVDNPTFYPPGQPPPNPPYTFDQLSGFAGDFIAPTIELHALLDGLAIPDLFNHREVSPSFSYSVPDNNVLDFFGYNFPGGTVVDPAAADGWYLMLKPLPVGPHTVNFGGTIDEDGNPATTDDDFHLDITYNIQSAPEPGTLALASLGIVGLCGYAWRKRKASAV